MILADTTMVVDYLRKPTPRMVQTIKDHDAAICGATLAEIYAGARSPADFKKYDKSLSVFGRASIPKKIWPSLGRNLSVLAAKGITVPFPDALIATVAIEHGLELWQHDRHFPEIQRVIPQLQLFQEPP
jgi:predicted nucleic acid-binding protein